MQPRISIIIPAWNNLGLNRRCLESIFHHRQQVSAEVVVVDNGSTDGSLEFFRDQEAAGRIRLLANESNLGFAKACNQGAREAEGELLLFLNNDTEALHGWLDALDQCVQAHPQAAVVGAKLLYPDESIQHAGVVFTNAWRVQHIYKGFHRLHPAVNKEREFQAVTGACMLVRRDVFMEVEGFFEGYVNGLEDLDLCLRIRKLGWQVYYTPFCEVVHHESKTPGRMLHETFNFRIFQVRWQGSITRDEDEQHAADGVTILPKDKQLSSGLCLRDTNSNVPWQMARKLVRDGHLAEAAETYRLALRMNPYDVRNVVILEEFADVCLRVEDQQTARMAYEALSAMAGPKPKWQQQLAKLPKASGARGPMMGGQLSDTLPGQLLLD